MRHNRTMIKTPVRQLTRRYCKGALIIGAATGVAAFAAGYPAVGRGGVLGTVFSMLNFILMGATLPWKIAVDRRRALAGSLVSLTGRCAVMAVALVIAARSDRFELWSTAAGLFAVPLCILGDHLGQAGARKLAIKN